MTIDKDLKPWTGVVSISKNVDTCNMISVIIMNWLPEIDS